MRRDFNHALLVLVVVFLFEAALVCCSQNTSFSCEERERQALLKFKAHFSDPSRMFSSWEGNNCCEWKGVGCDENNRYVVSLKLRGEGHYAGARSLAMNGSGDDVALLLLELRFLEHLDLSENDFRFSTIPPSFGLMKNLRYLNLSNAGFSGRIPHQLGNLSRLCILDMKSHSSLYGDDIGWISQLRSLHHLNMGGLDLRGALSSPNVFQVLSNFPSLAWLSLSRCGINSSHISGSYPFNSTIIANMQHLDLSNNSIHGPIPVFITNMTFLKELKLSENLLNGTISTLFESKLCALRRLDLSFNQFSGRISRSAGNLSELGYLNLRFNALNGSIPDSIGRGLSKLEILYFSDNQLIGTIPESIGQLFNLKRFIVSHNALEGVVSEAHFANLSKLVLLSIDFNSLNCEFKSDWRPPFQLEYISMISCKFGSRFPKWLQLQKRASLLDLSNASISGPLPENIGHLMPKLRGLFLADNHINGSIPVSIGLLGSLQYLDLSNNNLHGELHVALANCKNLQVLDLGENVLSGNITWIGENLQWLEVLRLHRNMFSSYIPLELCQLSRLLTLDLADNNLSGKIPSCFHNFSCMANQDCGGGWARLELLMEMGKGRYLNYKISGIIVEIPYMDFPQIDLSHNNFIGSIPVELASLVKLIGLNLSRNHLSGKIPEKIGQMKNLESLDLSVNGLSGTIPSSLVNLTMLAIIQQLVRAYPKG